MGVQQKRVVALLDVDNTLIFEKDSIIEYNDNLITALLNNNVKDVYLFSSMDLKNNSVAERVALIKYLESKGLKVHGTICASDLIWNKEKDLLKKFYQAVLATKTDEQIIQLLEQEEFQSLTHFDNAIPGQAFNAVKSGIPGWSSSDADLFQKVAVIISKFYLNSKDLSEFKKQIAQSEKSYFYQMFINNKPDWSGDVIFVDDASPNIEAVMGMHKKLNPEHQLLPLHNRDNKNNVKNPLAFYQNIIKSFLALFHALYNYSAGRRLTHSTAKNEILERVEQALRNCKTGVEVAAVKQTFQPEYTQLNSHRFSIWSNSKTRSAVAFDEMVSEREKQLQLN